MSVNGYDSQVDPKLVPLLFESEATQTGMALLLNCQFEEAAALFGAEKETNPFMALGYCLTLVLKAITSFDEMHKQEAADALKTVQHDCHHEQGRFKQMLESTLQSVANKDVCKQNENDHRSLLEKIARYQLDLVCADCYLCSAMITMMNMDLVGYMRGGWIVRKAWKLYEKLYAEAHRLNENVVRERKLSTTKGKSSTAGSPSTMANLESTLITKLFATVCFGYGLFNLLLSILSPQVLKVIAFFGFTSSRRLGLECLTLTSRSDVMRAPLATLSLLWFHTVARPFFALDGPAITSGVEEAERLLSSTSSRRLSGTMLFVFFRGRIHRLRSDITGAIDYYFKALHAAGNQKELRQMCHYELGWSYMHLMDWRLALPYFNELRETSKWAPSYYSYMMAVCSGACGETDDAKKYFLETTKNVKRKHNPVEIFVARRAKKLIAKKVVITQELCFLLVMEVMYIWRAILNVPMDMAAIMLTECSKSVEKWMLPLKCLVEGVLCAHMGRLDEAKSNFRECIARFDNQKDERHWPAFATYELGYLLMDDVETRSEAKNLLIEARDKFHGCDFDNRLNVRVHAALKMIEKFDTENATNANGSQNG